MKNFLAKTTEIFWTAVAIIGLGALIAGIVLIVKTNNPLMWLIIVFGLILLICGGAFSVYLFIIAHKRKVIRSRKF